MSDSFYHITECDRIKLKNKGQKHTHVAILVGHDLEMLRRNTYAQCFDL